MPRDQESNQKGEEGAEERLRRREWGGGEGEGEGEGKEEGKEEEERQEEVGGKEEEEGWVRSRKNRIRTASGHQEADKRTRTTGC